MLNMLLKLMIIYLFIYLFIYLLAEGFLLASQVLYHLNQAYSLVLLLIIFLIGSN
jgi:hypothetical protein